MTCTGRLSRGKGRILPNALVTGMEILKALELNSRLGGGRVNRRTEKIRAKTWNFGSRLNP